MEGASGCLSRYTTRRSGLFKDRLSGLNRSVIVLFVWRISSRFALLLVILASPAVAMDTKAKWIRVKTDHVEVLSDARQKDAVEFAVQYSAFRHVLGEMIGAPAQKLPASVVLLFENNRQF